MFPKMVGKIPPNHPILIGFSIINDPFWGIPNFLETPIFQFHHEVTPKFSGIKFDDLIIV